MNGLLRSSVFGAMAAILAMLPTVLAESEEMIQSFPLLTVLPVGAIPAIYNPRFVSVKEADRFLRPEEPVLGITDGKMAKAYSAWQLNHHEIVNDSLGDLPLAITW
jgi:hypothetical protein